MAKVERPLFSDEATGRIGLAASFKKGAVWDSIVSQFHRKQKPTPALRTQRYKFKTCVGIWRALAHEDQMYFAANAPTGWTGYQYFMSICVKEGDDMFEPNAHRATHEKGGSDEIIPRGKLAIRPSLDLATVGQKEKPTIVEIGVFNCFSLPIWSAPVNEDEELHYEFHVPHRWDGVSDIMIPFHVALGGNEDVGKKFRMQLAWEHDACGGVIPTTSNNIEIELEVLTGRNSQFDAYCVDFVVDYDIDGPGSEIQPASLLGGRLRRIAASSNEIAGEILVRQHLEAHQTINKFFGDW